MLLNHVGRGQRQDNGTGPPVEGAPPKPLPTGHWQAVETYFSLVHKHVYVTDSQWLTKGARGASKVPRESTTPECFTEV